MRNAIRIALVLAFHAAIAAAGAPAAPADEISLMVITERSGREETFAIAKEAAQRQPTWDPTRGEPPLGVTRAVELGLEWARKTYPNAKARLIDLRLLPLLREEAESAPASRWYSMLELTPTGAAAGRTELRVAVLMDGTVLPPRIGKGSYPTHRW